MDTRSLMHTPRGSGVCKRSDTWAQADTPRLSDRDRLRTCTESRRCKHTGTHAHAAGVTDVKTHTHRHGHVHIHQRVRTSRAPRPRTPGPAPKAWSGCAEPGGFGSGSPRSPALPGPRGPPVSPRPAVARTCKAAQFKVEVAADRAPGPGWRGMRVRTGSIQPARGSKNYNTQKASRASLRCD